jgi:uncharacterized lipoprotein
MKRFVAALVLLSMVFALTACKSDAEKQQEALVQQQMLAAQAQTAAANAQLANAQTTQVAAPAAVAHVSDTGNYDPSSDKYWTEFHCALCDKRWSKDGSH